jgi:hypothetical protein
MAEMTSLNRIRMLNSIPPRDRTLEQTAERIRLFQGLTPEERITLSNSRPTTPKSTNSNRPKSASYTNGGRPVPFGKLGGPHRKSRKSGKGRKSRKSRKSRKTNTRK